MWRRLRKHSSTKNKDSENLRTMRTFVYSSRVAADRLIAVVKQVNACAEDLHTIANHSSDLQRKIQSNGQASLGDLQATAAATEEVSSAAEAISRSMEKMSQYSEVTHRLLQQVVESLSTTESIMEQLTKSVADIEEKIEHFAHEAGKMEAVHQIIQKTVSKTNMLALNAGIEAARAGQHGKGFAVVAADIRRLAEQGKEAVSQSSEILEGIGHGMKTILEAARTGKEAVDAGVKNVKTIIERILDIAEQFTIVNESVTTTAKASHRQSALTAEVEQRTSHVAKAIETVIQDVHTILCKMDRQRENIQTLRDLASHLQTTAEQLSQSFDQVASFVREDPILLDTDRLNEHQEQLLALAGNPDITGMDPSRHARTLQQFLRTNPGFEAVWSNRTDGSFLFSEPPAGLVNAQERDWWIHAVKGEVYISDPYISVITHRPCVTIAVPIRGRDGQILGCLGADIKLGRDEFH
ncbi:MAG: hypothetical protein IRY98_10285 [Alicyclobacillaceae bacterium]|nr:hypothetical protein [Alicyclobacillaceae bacterium]